MNVFSKKLDGLLATVELAISDDVALLAADLVTGRGGLAYAIGSGGSAVSAEYLAVCREHLQMHPTIVQTPMQFVVGIEDLSKSQVWLFSARGENPDVLGALRAAVTRRAAAILVVTVESGGRLTREVSSLASARVHTVRVAQAKDGFLATHSLGSTVVTLMRAADIATGTPLGQDLDNSILTMVRERLKPDHRAKLASQFSSLAPTDTLMILSDPRLSPLPVLIETSSWETAMCPVQQTDFRNFAHGRHVWLSHRGAGTLILSLTGTDTRDAWRDIEAIIPSDLRRVHLDYANCSRFQNALAVFDGLGIVEAMGRACGIDPGKPGFGPFARGIYKAPSLEILAERLTPAVRQKQAAAALRDDPQACAIDMVAEDSVVRVRIGAAVFRALVLDYDGTVVSTEGRYDPPDPEIAEEFERLLDGGLTLAFATGRGGSAGENLRDLLSSRHHPNVLMGYYNGAYLCPLAVDIRDFPAPRDPTVKAALEWLRARPKLFRDGAIENVKDSGVQATIQVRSLSEPDGFGTLFNSEFGEDGRLRLVRSQHSFDICLADACKTKVICAVTENLSDGNASVLCIGDSGTRAGNDHALLGSPYGISVDQVCDRPDVCWSFFGSAVTGPDALLRILRALSFEGGSQVRLAVDDLRF